jgi:hypothetical protein
MHGDTTHQRRDLGPAGSVSRPHPQPWPQPSYEIFTQLILICFVALTDTPQPFSQLKVPTLVSLLYFSYTQGPNASSTCTGQGTGTQPGFAVGTGNGTQAINSISTISFSLLLIFHSCPLLAHKQFLVGTVAAFFSQSCPIQPEKDIPDTASSFFFLTPTPSCNGDLDLLRPIILKGPAPLGFRNRAVATRDPLPIQLDVLKPSRNPSEVLLCHASTGDPIVS